MKFSIIIPARDEEEYIPSCLDSIDRAAAAFPGQVEVIVVINRCTDATEDIARRHGARIAYDDSKNLARIRNAGARLATGEFLLTIDADSRMSPNMLEEIELALAAGRWIGGGVPIMPERLSLGIVLSGLFIMACVILMGCTSAGLFWCRRRDFEAVGGFDESVVIGEDVDFARRLKALGRKTGRKYHTLWRTRIVTSCRKFDRLGDWFLFLHPIKVIRAIGGKDQGLGNLLFYEYQRREPGEPRRDAAANAGDQRG
jgi:glycosyltransferase involved in cell wall biosynthesis